MPPDSRSQPLLFDTYRSPPAGRESQVLVSVDLQTPRALMASTKRLRRVKRAIVAWCRKWSELLDRRHWPSWIPSVGSLDYCLNEWIFSRRVCLAI